ncbi:multidrug effflux MFS transporter [Opacimonas viscosa]|uniref:Bcr/CflA family efflux transporter n=1 Tax=Opacimonas viscosa TaxID=2961944 RepID=A0AA41WYV5_9ALTE|nr:multidrug effflux MFS transporter [Opacimonas viscosa]MCP3429027.1 multidrug effflux MFS transporter [Opacimonas viscosa]
MSQINDDTTTHAKATLSQLEFVALMALLTSLVALSIDAMLPALTAMGNDLASTGAQQNHLVVSLFFIGMAFGQMFFGPFADARGRRATILVGMLIFVFGTFICMAAEDMTTMLVGRFVQAFGVSGPRIAAMAMIRDIYVGASMAKIMSFIMIIFILVPMAAPVIGQWIMLMSSWWYIFVFFLLITVLTAIWFFARQPETLHRSVRRPFALSEFVDAARFILTHRQVLPYIIAMGCIFGAFLAYLSASQTIFQNLYSTGEWFPYIFALLAFAIGCASMLNARLVEQMGMLRLCYLALFGHILTSLVLCIVVWFFGGLPTLTIWIGLLFVDFFFVGILFGNMNALAMQPLGQIAGVGAAFIGSLSSVVAVPLALFIDTFLADSLQPITLGFLILGLCSYGLFRVAEIR